MASQERAAYCRVQTTVLRRSDARRVTKYIKNFHHASVKVRGTYWWNCGGNAVG